MTLPARHLLLSAIAALFFAATLAGNWTSVRDSAIRAARDWTSWSDRGYRGNGEHTDAYRELVEKNVVRGGRLYYRPCSQDNRLTPAERSIHLALSWVMSPAPVRFGDAKCAVDEPVIVVSRFLDVEFPGCWLAAENDEAAIWQSGELPADEKSASCGALSSVSPWRELIGVIAVCSLIAVFVWWVLPGDCTGHCGIAGACVGSIAFFAFATVLTLSHTFVAPTGLGVYGGKAKLFYLFGGIPAGFFTDPAYSSFQPAYPPGLAFLTLVAYWVAGGCGEWLTQLIPVFVTALTLGLVLKDGSSSFWVLFLAFAAFLGEQTLQVSTFYYAEPFVALLALLGWMHIKKNKEGHSGWIVLGVAGLFKTEGLIVLLAIWLSFVACALKAECAKFVSRVLFKWGWRLALAMALPLAWHLSCHLAGATFYDYAPMWDFDFARFGAAAEYLLEAAFLEPWRYGFSYPMALAILIFALVSIFTEGRGRIPVSLIAASASSLICIVLFALVYSYSRVADFQWHLWSSAARLLWVPSLFVLLECAIATRRHFRTFNYKADIRQFAQGKRIAMIVIVLFLCGGGTLTARAASAANGLVTVSCDASRAQVAVNGNDFDVFAPGCLDLLTAQVMVTANGDWTLVEPTALPLRMKGGDIATYKVVRPPECSDGGTIAFHNYYIASDRDGGLKDIVVEAGANVTYTAHKNGSLCVSDWTVNGETKNDTSRIVFNRNWWDVPSWFVPSMDTPKPGVYNINAHDVQHTVLDDSGSMMVVGVDHLEVDTNGVGYVSVVSPLYLEKNSALKVRAFPAPRLATWPPGAPVWAHAAPLHGDSSEALVDTSEAGVFDVVATCGDSSKTLRVVVYECKVHVYVKTPSDDAPVAFNLSLMDSDKLDIDVGHTSWRLEVEPSDAAVHIQSLCAISHAKHLNACVGYYPSGGVGPSRLTPPGILRSGDSSEGTEKSFVVKTSQLVTGLESTYSVEQTPGTYVLGTHLWASDSSGGIIVNADFSVDRNCTSVCIGVLNSMGVVLPSAFTDWRDTLTVGGEQIDIEYRGNSPWMLYRQITR